MLKVKVNDREISDGKRINQEIEIFCKTLLKESVEKTSTEHQLFVETLFLLILKENEILQCKDVTGEELYEVMMNMTQEESPGNDRWTNGFYNYFHKSLKT